MRRLLTCLYGLVCCAYASCVLPDYQVGPDNKPPYVRDELSLPAAGDACNACVRGHCKSEFIACGEHCGDLSWPVSPAWPATAETDAFVKCLADRCDSECEVRWGCTGKYKLVEPDAPYEVDIRVVDTIAGTPAQGAEVSACHGSDPGCSDGMRSSGETDETGHVKLTLRSDFFGYFLIDAGERYPQLIAMWSQPVYRVDPTFTLSVFSHDWVAAMASHLSVEQKSELGQMVFRAQNCLPLRFLDTKEIEAAADGVSVAFNPVAGSDTFYVSYSLMVDRNADSTKNAGGGWGGALNLPTSTLSIVGSHEDAVVSNTGISLRPGSVGLALLVPNVK